MKIMMICSGGGHFRTLHHMRSLLECDTCIWVTFRSPQTEKTLQNELVYWAYSPTNRNLPNLIRNFWLAWAVLRQEQPDLILSTGAGVAVPFLILGKLLGCQTAFVESVTRVQQLSLSARLSEPFLDALYVHWPQLQARYPKSELITPTHAVEVTP
jgi:beta-1,4-N-acetylglucosaminyltransferase